MEVYQGKPIFYSLGNFSFGGNSRPRDFDTAMIQLEYDIGEKNGKKEKPRLVRLEVIPCHLSEGEVGMTQDYRPVKVTDRDARNVLKKLSKKSKGLPDGFFETGIWMLD